MAETTELRWFDEIPSCARCGKTAKGRLMGSSNQSFRWHCKRCAEKRLKDSEKARKEGAT